MQRAQSGFQRNHHLDRSWIKIGKAGLRPLATRFALNWNAFKVWPAKTASPTPLPTSPTFGGPHSKPLLHAVPLKPKSRSAFSSWPVPRSARFANPQASAMQGNEKRLL
ncbi:unnamed protein product [Linum trigynum]|uniref:Uncharacterized protein n=1 Tax=Linum trigynum TaxID=586398 RepID=A0AAV2F8N7_9ROSI